MQVLPLLAEVPVFEHVDAAIAWFAISTIVFLILSGLVLRRSRAVASQLISLGLLAAVLSVAYGGFSPMALLPLSAGLMKIAVLLVLGGVACSVLSFLVTLPAADAAKAKEAVHDR